jgi:outer membrane lipoprotein carrier protein
MNPLTSAVLGLALGLASLTPRALGAQGTDATVDRAVAAWKKVTSLRASFEQTVTNPLTRKDETARGEYLQQGRNRISVRFTSPAGDRIVADGTALWLYLPSSAPGQVIRTTPGSAATVDWTAQFLDAPRTRYTIAGAGRATIDGRATTALVLTPRQKDVPFSRAKVWVDDRDGLIRQFEVVDASGVLRRVRLTSLQVNVPVDASAFRFTPPKGVRVVQQ